LILKIATDLEFLRKSFFIYWLTPFNDEIMDIETGIDGRDRVVQAVVAAFL
jgi:hypothetical protein